MLAQAYDDDLVRNYNLLSEFMVETRVILGESGLPHVKDIEVTWHMFPKYWMIPHCTFMHMALNALLHIIQFPDIWGWDVTIHSVAQLAPWQVQDQRREKIHTGYSFAKKTYVHIGTVYVEIPSWFVFTLASQFGALAHLRIGPTWKRTGCMPCWVICTSWFAKAWPAGQLKHHTTGAHTFLGEIPKLWANFRREKITVLKAL